MYMSLISFLGIKENAPFRQSRHSRVRNVLRDKVRRSGSIEVRIEVTSVIADQLSKRLVGNLRVTVDVHGNALEDGRFQSD